MFNIFDESDNVVIIDSFSVAEIKIPRANRIVCSISGGADSDVMLDLLTKVDRDKKIKYVFFDTGIEYEATKRHLEFLENKYGITIERVKAITPVPLGCKKYGLPFWSKFVSEMIDRLQKYDFKWEDKPFDELLQQYPKCKAALKWWCNLHGEGSRFNIEYTPKLKEFIIENPPTFRISNKCCYGAKKNNAKVYLTEQDAELNCVGIRKAEGGIRAAAYKTCFTPAKTPSDWDNFRPIFWYSDEDKRDYENTFGVTHSECYTRYGLERTGCAGCPFGKDFEKELKIIRKYEPRLYAAVCKIFGESYDYTRRYLTFRSKMFSKNGVVYKQLDIFDMEVNG